MTIDTKDPKTQLVQPVKLGSKMNKFHQQIADGAKVAAQTQTSTGTPSFADMSSTVIFPDCSGSMSDPASGDYGSRSESHDKAYFCREAVKTFIDNCFLGATKVGLASFPELVVVEPTHDLAAVKLAADQITPTGSTPMSEPLDFVLDEWPITHGIVVSDGSPDSVAAVESAAKRYKDKGVKLDAVHIGSDTGGEACMKMIAETTGGIYIKFTNVKAFADSFKYLTPRHRLTLTTSKNPTLLLNAAEVKL